ncbi:MAG: hypothetical protein QW299_07235 [Candidatus Caldarchaeum sp.]|jgi:hypothetical protein
MPKHDEPVESPKSFFGTPIKSQVTIYLARDGSLPDEWQPLVTVPNQLQYDWARIAVQLFGFGRGEYRISGMYIEYENVANPNDPVSVPSSFPRSEGREYYQGLTGNKDYLRVPLLSLPSPFVSAGLESEFDGTGINFNSLSFFALTAGTQGVLGRPFSASNNSKIYGLALISSPNWNDPTKDLIFSRTYFSGPNQILKSVAYQVGVRWSHSFT